MTLSSLSFRSLSRVLLLSAGLLAPACGDLSSNAFAPGRLRIVVVLNPATVGQFDTITVEWTGTWGSDIPDPDPGIPAGDASTTGSVAIERDDQAAEIELPRIDELRRGFWSIAVTASGDSGIAAATCNNVEIVTGRTLRLTIAEGSTECTTALE